MTVQSPHLPRFIPLDNASQSSSDNILYYDNHASIYSIFECLTGRLAAVLGLLEALHEYNNPPPYAVQNIAIASTLLLSDANSLLKVMQSLTKDK